MARPRPARGSSHGTGSPQGEPAAGEPPQSKACFMDLQGLGTGPVVPKVSAITSVWSRHDQRLALMKRNNLIT
ncbi:hypothetical protein EYF80_056978 [Liparis tanakae]|uniref:Uncharacterized protein n=1 Tax=Liparis tanakae TaxID=230148 RepID=A0A4Z2EW39_9TELE|nr:hypothetical protein EYF80_056978 [Liparis tanakae]